MLYLIKNENLAVGVKSFGAVLTSIKSEETGFEFLWQGNPEVWNGQSPILFPIIGRLLDDECFIDGKRYSIIRHGLARHREFELETQRDNYLCFVQRENAETLESFPYKYELKIEFELSGNSLTVTHSVKNTNEREMYFSLGAHPAFNCGMGDRIVFEKKETKYCERIDENSLLIENKDLILDDSDTIEIYEHLFDKDVMIFEKPESKFVTLVSNDSDRRIKFTFGDAPFFSVWAKPNAPFVCLEPWYGINDSYEKKDDFSNKRGNQKLEAAKTFSFSWTAEITE